MKTKLYSLMAALMMAAVLAWPITASAHDWNHYDRGNYHEHFEHDRGWWGPWHDRDDYRYAAPAPYAYNWPYGNYYNYYPTQRERGWWCW